MVNNGKEEEEIVTEQPTYGFLPADTGLINVGKYLQNHWESVIPTFFTCYYLQLISYEF